MTIGIIGGGNMGSALAKAFVLKKITAARNITVSDQNQEKLDKLSRELEVKTSRDNSELLKADFLVIAVKPQGFADMAKEIAGKVSKKTVVISIMAGISIRNIQDQLGHKKVIRSMPNTPAMIGEGVTAWIASEEISAEEKKTVQELLESTGYAFEVKDEGEMIRIGTIVGSGPGFTFYVIEQWLKGTEVLNLDPNLRKTVLLKVLKGSISLAEQSQDSLEQLRKNVTSPGGFTEAGLTILTAGGLEELFRDMLISATLRTAELDGEMVDEHMKEKIRHRQEFNLWNQKKKQTEKLHPVDIHEGGIYCGRVGKNIGVEQHGKGEESLRPILVFKKFDRHMFWGIPLSKTKRRGSWYFPFSFKTNVTSVAILPQIRLFDSRRLKYIMGYIRQKDFLEIRQKISNFLKAAD
ncbi:MAG: pyrroline-5-carboxylate reductase [bacterium]|nr:pyrroline-5-carboxylate reductase [bacterium]